MIDIVYSNDYLIKRNLGPIVVVVCFFVLFFLKSKEIEKERGKEEKRIDLWILGLLKTQSNA